MDAGVVRTRRHARGSGGGLVDPSGASRDIAPLMCGRMKDSPRHRVQALRSHRSGPALWFRAFPIRGLRLMLHRAFDLPRGLSQDVSELGSLVRIVYLIFE